MQSMEDQDGELGKQRAAAFAPGSVLRERLFTERRPTESKPPPPRSPVRLSQSSQRALTFADELRKAAGAKSLMSEMLLYGLSRKSTGAAHTFIQARTGGDPSAQIAQAFKMSPPDDVTSSPFDVDSVPLSAHMQSVMRAARNLATGEWLEERHLFMAILDVPESVACQWLASTFGAEMPLDWVREALREWPADQDFNVDQVNERVAAARITLARSAFSDGAATVDRLDFETHTRALAEIIQRPETRPPVVIGVYGPWGSGKSTFLELVQRHLEQASTPRSRPKIISVQYNAWAYTDATKLWAGLVKQVSKSLDAELRWWQRIRYALTKRAARVAAALAISLIPIVSVVLSSSVHWLAGAGAALATTGLSLLGLTGYGSVERRMEHLAASYDAKALDGVMGDIRGELQGVIKKFFVKPEPAVAERVRDGKVKLVIFIDELDRCPLDRIVDILEAIKLFLAEEIFIVLLAIDTRVAGEAIHLHYKDVATPQLAREYLEKIVQIPLHVPKPSSVEALLRDLMPMLPDSTGPTPAPTISQPRSGRRDAGRTTPESKPKQPMVLRSELRDSDDEFQLLRDLSAKYLDNNPRRLKRLLNTYRYVKLLGERRRQPTKDAAWQRRTLSWLAFTQRWPDFMVHAIESAARSAAPLSTSLTTYSGDKPAAEDIHAHLDISAPEIAVLAHDAGNFLLENPPSHRRAH